MTSRIGSSRAKQRGRAQHKQNRHVESSAEVDGELDDGEPARDNAPTAPDLDQSDSDDTESSDSDDACFSRRKEAAIHRLALVSQVCSRGVPECVSGRRLLATALVLHV